MKKLHVDGAGPEEKQTNNPPPKKNASLFFFPALIHSPEQTPACLFRVVGLGSLDNTWRGEKVLLLLQAENKTRKMILNILINSLIMGEKTLNIKVANQHCVGCRLCRLRGRACVCVRVVGAAWDAVVMWQQLLNVITSPCTVVDQANRSSVLCSSQGHFSPLLLSCTLSFTWPPFLARSDLCWWFRHVSLSAPAKSRVAGGISVRAWHPSCVTVLLLPVTAHDGAYWVCGWWKSVCVCAWAGERKWCQCHPSGKTRHDMNSTMPTEHWLDAECCRRVWRGWSWVVGGLSAF